MPARCAARRARRAARIGGGRERSHRRSGRRREHEGVERGLGAVARQRHTAWRRVAAADAVGRGQPLVGQRRRLSGRVLKSQSDAREGATRGRGGSSSGRRARESR